MNNNLRFDVNVDEDTHTVTVVREFAASRDRVWTAWTSAEMLDQWWAPKPYVAKTKELNLEPGGRWLYAMVGPDGGEHWCRAIYSRVDRQSAFSYDDASCDAAGTVTDVFPGSNWNVIFTETGETTTVTAIIRHNSAADLEAILKMGFKEGFAAGLGNLHELLESGDRA